MTSRHILAVAVVVPLVALLGAGLIMERVTEAMAAGGLITTTGVALFSALQNADQQRERLAHEKSEARLARIAAVRADDVDRVRRWIRELSSEGLRAQLLSTSALIPQRGNPDAQARLLEISRQVSARMEARAVEFGDLDGVVISLSSQALAEALRELSEADFAMQAALEQQAEFARTRWDELGEEAHREGMRVAKAMMDARLAREVVARGLAIELERFAAGD